MARTNVEDDWFIDITDRRKDLIRLVAARPKDPEHEADGLALDAWRTAQRYWKDDKKLIPEDVWRRRGLEPMIEADLAERRPGGIYVKGTEEQHDWLVKQTQAGKARAASGTRDEHGRFASSSAGDSSSSAGETSSQLTSSGGRLDQPLLYSTPLDASGDVRRTPKKTRPSKAQVVPSEPRGPEVWAAYRAAYFARYKVEPVRNAKMNSLCAQLVKRLGGDAAIGVVRFFLTHQKAYYVQNAHDLSACVKDAEALHTQMLAGYRVTQTTAQQADKHDANRQAFLNVARKFEAEEELKRGSE